MLKYLTNGAFYEYECSVSDITIANRGYGFIYTTLYVKNRLNKCGE